MSTKPKKTKTPKPKPLGECCPLMVMVISRHRASDRLGLSIEQLFSRSGPTREAIVLRFNKSKDRKAEMADATFAMVEYCPFCGASLTSTKPGAKP